MLGRMIFLIKMCGGRLYSCLSHSLCFSLRKVPLKGKVCVLFLGLHCYCFGCNGFILYIPSLLLILLFHTLKNSGVFFFVVHLFRFQKLPGLAKLL